MRTLATTQDTNDLYLDASGNLAMLFGTPATAQETRHFAATQRGEKYYETTTGTLFFNATFGAQTNLTQFRESLRDSILRTPEVESIVSLEVVRDGEIVRYNAVIQESRAGAVIEING